MGPESPPHPASDGVGCTVGAQGRQEVQRSYSGCSRRTPGWTYRAWHFCEPIHLPDQVFWAADKISPSFLTSVQMTALLPRACWLPLTLPGIVGPVPCCVFWISASPFPYPKLKNGHTPCVSWRPLPFLRLWWDMRLCFGGAGLD